MNEVSGCVYSTFDNSHGFRGQARDVPDVRHCNAPVQRGNWNDQPHRGQRNCESVWPLWSNSNRLDRLAEGIVLVRLRESWGCQISSSSGQFVRLPDAWLLSLRFFARLRCLLFMRIH